MTKDELYAIRERWEDVTGKEWEVVGNQILTVEKIDIGGEGDRKIAIPHDFNDTKAIAHARADIPTLLAYVKELEKNWKKDVGFLLGECDRLQEEIDSLGK